MKAGIFLQAREEGNDFDDTIIFITEWNSQGATGFICNKKFERSLNELEEFKHSPAFPLYTGGPVMPEQLYFAHCCPQLVAGGMPISGGVHLGGDFKQALSLLNDNRLTEKDIKLFIGYCGWEAGQLEAEINNGSWQEIEASLSSVFL